MPRGLGPDLGVLPVATDELLDPRAGLSVESQRMALVGHLGSRPWPSGFGFFPRANRDFGSPGTLERLGKLGAELARVSLAWDPTCHRPHDWLCTGLRLGRTGRDAVRPDLALPARHS